jgi:formiminotetrahydrofolate cyclodeaminase
MMARRVIASEEIDTWLDALASGASEPGGGAFASLSAAAGAALVESVANQTMRRTDPKDTNERLQAIADEAEAARPALLAQADRGSSAFEAILAANRMPRATDEERAARLVELQATLEAAIDVQLDLGRRSVYLMGLAEEVTSVGDPNAAADGMSAAASLHSATVCAMANVEINAFAIVDEGRRHELLDTCASLRQRADHVLDDVQQVFRVRINPA